MKFRKKPVVIEALQLSWATWGEMCDFVGVGHLAEGRPEGCWVTKTGQGTNRPTDEMDLWIPTLEGLHLAREYDWIIKGIKGELYSCKPDIFEATYEHVPDYESDS